jgi:predicted ATPase
VTALHGRRREVDHIESMLRSERAVSLTGPGGVGKTRLAGAIAEDHAAAGGTVHYLPLASVPARTATLVELLAGALGLRVESPQHALAAIQERLGTEAQLLVIDNCEHVLDGARDLVDGLLAVPSNLTILTTSRRPLGLTAECVVRVGPLTEPSAGGDDDWEPALRLFVERARRVRPTWQPVPAELAKARAIIARLGAIPLAIELAAGRLSSFALDDLAARLDQALDLLADGRPTAAVRQSSLRNTLKWSYELLNDDEQRLLRHLSVFADGADLTAVELVGSGIGLPAGGASELAALVDSSLVDADLDTDARYTMLEPVRAFAGWHLNRSVDRPTAAALFARWARQTAATIDLDGRGPNERTADQRLRRELRNLRAAHRAALDSDDLDTAISISASVMRVGTFRDLSDIWVWALDLADHPDLTGHPRAAHALGAAAEAAWLNGDLDRAGRLGQHGLTIDDQCVSCRHALASVQLFRGDPAGAYELWAGISEHDGSYLAQTGLAAVYAGDVITAETVLDRARAWAAEHGAPTDVAVARYATGELLGPETTAVEHYEQAIALTRDVGSTFVEGIATVGLASIQAAAGRPDDALRLYERVVRYWLRTGNWTQQWTTLRNLATLLAELGDQPTADILVNAAARAPAAATAKPAQRSHLSAPDEGPTVPRRQVVAIALDAITRTQAGRERSGGAC